MGIFPRADKVKELCVRNGGGSDLGMNWIGGCLAERSWVEAVVGGCVSLATRSGLNLKQVLLVSCCPFKKVDRSNDN